MKGPLHIALTLLLALVIAFSNSSMVLADGDDGEHTMEAEVNGVHVSLANQNEWKKGENTIIVTLKDSSGFPVNDANVEILIGPMSGEHAASEDDHRALETAAAHGSEQGHSSMPGMEMSEPVTETQEETDNPVSLEELGQDGIYVAETHLESTGTHKVNVMFHINGEMLQADFIVEVPGMLPKTIVLWSFVAINVVLIASAGIMKKQSVTVKG